MKGYKGYNNKFEIAEGLLNTPLETVKQMRKDPEFQKSLKSGAVRCKILLSYIRNIISD